MRNASCPVLLLVGRDDWQQDELLNATLLQRLRRQGLRVVWEDPAAEFLQWVRQWGQRLAWWPAGARQALLRLAKLGYCAARPSYLRYLLGCRDTSVESRCVGLRRLVAQLGCPARVVVLARSAGGRVTSLVADDLGLGHVICLGYPFRHPEKPDEPERYRHLTHLRTPMLIVQGTRDAYGGRGIDQRYALSRSITVRYVDTTHHFPLEDSQVDEVVATIEQVLARFASPRERPVQKPAARPVGVGSGVRLGDAAMQTSRAAR